MGSTVSLLPNAWQAAIVGGIDLHHVESEPAVWSNLDFCRGLFFNMWNYLLQRVGLHVYTLVQSLHDERSKSTKSIYQVGSTSPHPPRVPALSKALVYALDFHRKSVASSANLFRNAYRANTLLIINISISWRSDQPWTNTC